MGIHTNVPHDTCLWERETRGGRRELAPDLRCPNRPAGHARRVPPNHSRRRPEQAAHELPPPLRWDEVHEIAARVCLAREAWPQGRARVRERRVIEVGTLSGSTTKSSRFWLPSVQPTSGFDRSSSRRPAAQLQEC